MEKRKLNHCKSRNTEQAKWTETLAPKGTESDHSGSVDIMGDGQTIPGLQMAPKVFVIICDVELGKPYVLPECPGNDLARGNDGPEGRGIGKKRKATCNELYRGSRFALTRKGADLLLVFHGKERRYTCECTKFNDANKRETCRQRPETSMEFY